MNEPEKPYNSNAILHEISGSMGNFGTVLPIVLGAALVSEVDLGPALLFFGVCYIVMGIHYGILMSVEPMKAIGAIAEELTSGEIAASGLILGAGLLALGLIRGFERLQGLILERVVRGVQLGLGLILLRTSAGFISQYPIFAPVSIGFVLVFLFAKSWRNLPDLSILAVFGVVIGYGIFTRGVPDIQSISISIDPVPDPATFIWAGWHLVLPQTPLTLTNATVAAALTAGDLYKRKIEPDRLCVAMGVMNLASVPFGVSPYVTGSAVSRPITGSGPGPGYRWPLGGRSSSSSPSSFPPQRLSPSCRSAPSGAPPLRRPGAGEVRPEDGCAPPHRQHRPSGLIHQSRFGLPLRDLDRGGSEALDPGPVK